MRTNVERGIPHVGNVGIVFIPTDTRFCFVVCFKNNDTLCVLWFGLDLFSRGLIFTHFHLKTIRGILKFTHFSFV